MENKIVKDKIIRFPKELVIQVQKYQKENSITTFTGAVLELLRKGLAS